MARARKRVVERTINPQSHCKFFALPAELRNRIYTLAFSPDDFMNQTFDDQARLHLTQHPTHPERPSVLVFLQTCRWIHDEACCIFYALHPLSINCNTLDNFVAKLSTKRRGAVANLSVTIDWLEHGSCVLKSLRKLHGLRTVEIVGKSAWKSAFSYSPQHLQKTFQREQYFLEEGIRALPRGVEEVRFTLYDLRTRAMRDEVREQYERLEREMDEVFRKASKEIGGQIA